MVQIAAFPVCHMLKSTSERRGVTAQWWRHWNLGQLNRLCQFTALVYTICICSFIHLITAAVTTTTTTIIIKFKYFSYDRLIYIFICRHNYMYINTDTVSVVVKRLSIRLVNTEFPSRSQIFPLGLEGGGGGGHEMRLNAKGTVGSFGGRTLIYNKIITRKI